jgi:hypothetical protein
LVASLVSITDGVDFNNSLAIIAISVIAGSSWSAALEMIKGVVNSFAGSDKLARKDCGHILTIDQKRLKGVRTVFDLSSLAAEIHYPPSYIPKIDD